MYVYFILISLLNLLDGGLTAWGLTTGKIQEGNPIMDMVWKMHPLLFLGIKLALSILILLVGYFFHKQAITKHYWKMILFFVFVLYVGVLILHLFWIFPVSS